MTNNQKDNPFLYLTNDDVIKNIKIDSELIPAFKIVMAKINDYFSKNGLMIVKDWNSFLERFLINDGPEQVSIKGEILSNETYGGIYLKKENKIKVNLYDPNSETISFTYLCNSLCHEFIHFLVMHDSNSLNHRISDSSFLNEGMTEYLTGCIMGGGNSSLYFKEYQMAEFYCKLTKNPLASFLNDKFAFEDDYYAPGNLIRCCQRFMNNNDLDSYLGIQREIILQGLKEYSVNSFDDFVNIISIINQRPMYDGEYTDYIFDNIANKYIETLNIDDQQKTNIKNKLIVFCKISNKYHLYGENEVSEFLIDDLHIAFDKKGNNYNDFPLNGTRERGQIGFDGVSKITVIHRDEKYEISTENMNCINWKPIYDKTYGEVKNEITSLSNQVL